MRFEKKNKTKRPQLTCKKGVSFFSACGSTANLDRESNWRRKFTERGEDRDRSRGPHSRSDLRECESRKMELRKWRGTEFPRIFYVTEFPFNRKDRSLPLTNGSAEERPVGRFEVAVTKKRPAGRFSSKTGLVCG